MADKVFIKVVMTKDKPGSPDGISSYLYKKGEEYELPKDLATAFIEDLGVAELAAPAKSKKQNENEYDPALNLGLGGKKNAKPSYNKKIADDLEKEEK